MEKEMVIERWLAGFVLVVGLIVVVVLLGTAAADGPPMSEHAHLSFSPIHNLLSTDTVYAFGHLSVVGNIIKNKKVDPLCNEQDGCYPHGDGCEERDYYCAGNGTGCNYTSSNRHNDSWVDTGNTRWVDENECKQKEQKEQEYRDYECYAGSCNYSINATKWIDTGNTSIKANGTICGCTANNTVKRCYDGNCTDTGIGNSSNCCAGVAGDGKEPGESCGDGRICNSTCNCVSRAPPGITSFTPLSYVDDTIGNGRTFNVMANQAANVSWYLNGLLVLTNASVREAKCTLLAEVVGEHNVTAIASNANGSDMQMWIWNVTELPKECEGTDTYCGIYPNCGNCTEQDGCYPHGDGCEERNYYCMGNEAGCNYTSSNRHTDSWVDTGNTRWVDENECKQKEQKEQEYRDYKCSAGSCNYSINNTKWVDTGNTSIKANGTICGCTANNTVKRCYDGNCTDTGIGNTSNCCAGVAGDGKEFNCTCGDICVITTGWWRNGSAFHPSDTPIQAAIDNATAGETICVKDGTYTENVDVDAQLTIRSENGAASTTVNALYSNDHVFEVTADYVSISGFTVECATGGGEAGIYLDSNIGHCNIYDNNASGNYYGIYLSRSSNNTITSNTVSNNDMDGIELWVSSNNAITSNIAFNNTCGISLYSSNSNMISDNTASSNSYGISLSPAIGGPPSSDNKVTNNIASNNDYDGISLSSSSDNNITNNTASNNDYDGIRLSYSSDNTLTNNIASNNYGYGINLDESNNNRVYNNYFDNTNNAWDDGNNIWNITKIAGPNIIGSSWLGGNYWSDYDGIDTNGDGLGDTKLPYNSNGNILISGDKHPLVPAGIAPRLSIEKSDNPDSVQPGGTLNYFINLSNTGYINATNAIVTETYDDNVTFVSAIPAPSEGDDTWIFSALNANETKWINISVSVNPSTPIGTILHNIVTVSCAEGFTDSDTEVTTVLSGEPNCTCGDICVITTGWWRDGGAFNPSDSPIQDAIDNAITSDTICVKDGEYNENVDVHKRLTIRSENGATSTIVNALYPKDQVFEVTADYVTISGFTVKGATGILKAGIYLDSYIDHCNIYDNKVMDNSNGIYLPESSHYNSISSNIAVDNGNGICISSSSGNKIYNNSASSNSCGIRLFSSNSNTISDNSASSNTYGIRLSSSSDNKITSNTASSNYYGIPLLESNNNTISSNNVFDSNSGISLSSSSSNRISNNSASNNNYGGICLYSSSDNKIANNSASSNNYGIRLDESNNNLIYNNYFDNTNNAWDDGNNVWNIAKTAGTNIICGSWLGGNYWSDYEGIDANGDGLGDTLLPYNSNGDILIGGDMHPLVTVGYGPLLSIEKSDDPDPVQSGGRLNYSILVNNVGYIATTNVRVIETYDVSVTYESAIPVPSEGNGTWIFPSVNANETRRINISVTVKPSTPIGTVLYNIVNVTCDEGVADSDTEATTVFSGEHNCTCGDIGVITTGWWRDGGAFNPSDTPIQDAIDNAITGDTICVKDGEYNENVDVDKRLAIKSENGAASTTVNAVYSKDNIFDVTSDYVSISGFTVKGATGLKKAGILGCHIDHCNISDNKASDNFCGIYLWDSSNYNSITNNSVSNNEWYGIYLSYSSNNNLIYNNYFNNTDNANDEGTNIWNITPTLGGNIIGGSWLGGNYWSDYAGEDTNGDGLGDTLLPYNASGEIITGGDWHPLVQEPSPCFIATAAYGTPLHEDINVLRKFRDEYLMPNPVGEALVKIYYTTSPPVADLIRANEGLRTAVRAGLVKPLVDVTRRFV